MCRMRGTAENLPPWSCDQTLFCGAGERKVSHIQLTVFPFPCPLEKKGPFPEPRAPPPSSYYHWKAHNSYLAATIQLSVNHAASRTIFKPQRLCLQPPNSISVGTHTHTATKLPPCIATSHSCAESARISGFIIHGKDMNSCIPTHTACASDSIIMVCYPT